MAVTKEQALTAQEFHDESRPCYARRSNSWRRNGKTKTWKRTPERFQVPVAFGLYSHGYITNSNAEHFHTELDCTHEVAVARRPAETHGKAAERLLFGGGQRGSSFHA